MPNKPKRPCNHPGCNELTTERYCENHKQEIYKAYDNNRGSSYQRGYDSRWRKARLGFLRKHPLCVNCEKQGQVTAATEVDHIIPHRGDKKLFWERDNWQPLCKPCHSSKTARGE